MLTTNNRQVQDCVWTLEPVPGLGVTVTYNREAIAAGFAELVATWVCWVVDAMLQRAEEVMELGQSCRALSGRWVARQGVRLAQKREVALEQLAEAGVAAQGVAGVVARATGRRIAVALAAVVLPPVFRAQARLDAGKRWLQGHYLRYTEVLTLPHQ